MIKLVAEAIQPDAFAPFGIVIRAPMELARIQFPAAFQNLRPAARATLTASRSPPQALPLATDVMERHRFSTQVFLPLDVARYVVMVAPHSAAGMPDMRRARAFMVPGDIGISYAADTWHHPMVVLNRPGAFAVILWRENTPSDIETIKLEETIEIYAP
jgi:ureidoglycolate lyase